MVSSVQCSSPSTMNEPSAPSVTPKRIARGIHYLGQLGARLRDLQGFATLAFELIQNADDVPGATWIRFDVRDDVLVVDNDAAFSDCGDAEGPVCVQNTAPPSTHLCDFHRFREVAAGDKRNQENTSGAFGFGFTAVYQMTDRPELISGPHHWILEEARPEAERVLVCNKNGCTACGREDLPGTRFLLPWARNPESELRLALGAGAVQPNAPELFLEELTASVPTTLLFLRRLRKIEVLRNGRLELRIECEPDPEQGLLLLQDSRGGLEEWILVDGGFSEEASRLRDLYGARIEPKRRHDVRLAIRRVPEERGVFCAFLPTRQSVGMPLHLNADFFPSNDRKRIQSGTDYQGEWNRAAIRAAACALSESLPRLATELGHEGLWRILSAAHGLVREVEEGRAESGVETFWEEISSRIEVQPVVYTSSGDWRTPHDPVYRIESPDSDLKWLSSIGIESVHNDLRPYYNLLAKVGVPWLDVGAFAAALRGLGLDHELESAAWPEPLREDDGLQILWSETGRVLARARTAETQDQAREVLAGCSIVLGRGGSLHPCTEIFSSDETAAVLFGALDPEAQFASATTPAEIRALCSTFGLADALSLLQRRLEDQRFQTELDPAPVLAWFQAQLPDLRDNVNARQRLRDLAIFPGGDGGLHQLRELALPGGFSDPLGLATVIDERRAGAIRPLLELLRAQQLTVARYASQLLPRAFDDPATPDDAKVRALAILAGHLEELGQGGDVPRALAAVRLVPCRDGEWRPAGHVYFEGATIAEVLGQHAPIAAMPPGVVGARALFEWLGVAETPRLYDCVALIEELVCRPPTEEAVEVVRVLFRHLGERVRGLDALPRQLERLRTLRWLPSQKAPGRWLAPSQVHASYSMFLYESQACFLDIPLPIQTQSAQLVKLLEIPANPTIEQIVSHLLHSAAADKPVNLQVYRRLDDSADHAEVGRLRGAACLLLPDGRYVRAADVFWSENPFGPYRIRLGDQLRQYSRLFNALGVRERPEAADAVQVLKEIAEESGDTDTRFGETVEIVQRCWRRIDDELDRDSVLAGRLPGLLGAVPCVPVAGGVLLPPRQVLFEDRAGLSAPFGPDVQARCIPRVPGAWRAMMAAGAASLASSVEVRLLEAEHPTIVQEIRDLIGVRQHALLRILGSVGGQWGPSTVADELTTLEFAAVSALSTQPVLRLDGGEVRGQVAWPTAHLDAAARTLYFRLTDGRAPWTAIAREIALFLFPHEEPGTIASPLKEVLTATSASESERALDELGFPPLDLQATVQVEDTPIESLGGESTMGEVASVLGDDSMTEGAAHLGDEASSPSGASPPDVTAPPPITAQSDATPPTGSTGNTTAPDARTGGEQTRPRARSHRQARPQSRLLTYVVPEELPGSSRGETGGDGSGEDPVVTEHRRLVDAAGVEHVRAYERRHGREAQVMPPGHPGYDVESAAVDGLPRFIEVKSTAGLWEERGVAVSRVQFGAAWENGDDFWLYVVERALDEDAPVYAIRNPARRVGEFMYDGGWKGLAEDEGAPAADVTPPTQGAI